MARLVDWPAPGVSAISSRVTSVVGVTDSSCAGGASEVTVTVCACFATFNSICRIGAVPESTASFSSCPPKSALLTVMRYSPIGTESKWNSPSALVRAVRVNCEFSAFNTTSASAIGRCCASCTIPRTVANTVASNTPPHNSREPNKNEIRRAISLLHKNANRSGRGRPEASARSGLSKKVREFLQTREKCSRRRGGRLENWRVYLRKYSRLGSTGNERRGNHWRAWQHKNNSSAHN